MKALTGLSEVFRYWDVTRNLFLQDLRVKYRGTFFGYFWSLLNPILHLGVLSLVFSQIVRIDTPHYPIYLFAGFIPWNFFSNAVTSGSRIYLENSFFLKKVYLPKLVFPFSRSSLALFDFTASLVSLGCLGLLIGLTPSLSMLSLPLAILSVALFTFGVVVIVATFTVFFRDFQYLVGVFLQILYFLTPIIYLKEMIPEAYRPYFLLNPLYWQVNLFQKIIYYQVFPTAFDWMLGLGIAVITFIFALFLTARLEDELVFRL